jgi:exopolyphosphatase/guanosine-5'-triphosphate,3'-diphosphate pyrophosphatase
LVGRVGADGELEVLEDRCEIPRLGEGLDGTGEIGEPALRRVELLLEDYLVRARELGCAELVVGGTAALRRARNQADVCARLGRVAADGVELVVEVIGEADEARYGWQAVADGDAATSVVDVGGGSTEVVAARGSLMRSAPVGAVVLTERLAGCGWAELFGAACAAVAGLGAGERAGFAADAPWVALGGTPSNLASLALGLEEFDHLAVEGVRLPTGAAREWGERLVGLPLEERLRLPIEAARAEVLPAGLACLAATLELFGPDEIRVSGRGLRFGLLAARLGLSGG